MLGFVEGLPEILKTFKELLRLRNAVGYGFEYKTASTEFKELSQIYYEKVEKYLKICEKALNKQK